MLTKLRWWLSRRMGNDTTEADDEPQDADTALGNLIRTLTSELRTCKRQVSIVMASEEKLKQQVARHINMVTKLEVESLKAAGLGHDERALDIIRKKKRYEATVEQLKRQLAKHRSVSDTIQETVRKIELKIEEARRKKLLLVTQRQAYETSRRLSDGLQATRGGNLLEEIEDDVSFLQTETRLALDIDVDRIGLEDLDYDEPDDRGMISEDEELAALKARLEESTSTPLLDEGRSTPSSSAEQEHDDDEDRPAEEPLVIDAPRDETTDDRDTAPPLLIIDDDDEERKPAHTSDIVFIDDD